MTNHPIGNNSGPLPKGHEYECNSRSRRLGSVSGVQCNKEVSNEIQQIDVVDNCHACL
jgi:hypothetical protein